MTPEQEQKILNDCIGYNLCEKLVEQYWNLVCSVVRKTFTMKQVPLIKEDLEEVYQEIFFNLLDDKKRRLRLYKEGKGRSLARWIVVIANRTTLNCIRKRGFDSLRGQYFKAELNESHALSGNTEGDILNRVTLDEALKIISETESVILKLHRYGMSSKDIAVVVDSTQASINNRISKIRKKLRNYIDGKHK